MINKLQIRGFRKNKKLDVEFDKITVLRGASGSGKSSMVGALKWVVFNQPSGDSCINWEMDSAIVRLFFDNKHKLIHKRSKAQNYYKLNKKIYKAFKTGVPDDISSPLKMNGFNFHRQHAGPFWFSQTAGEVSRQLNRIVNLDIIDTTTSKLLRKQTDTRTIIKDIENDIKKAREEKNDMRFVLRMDKDLFVLEKQEKQAIKITQNALLLTNLLQTRINIVSDKENAAQRVSVARIAMSKGDSYTKIKSKRQNLLNLVESAQNYTKILTFEIPDIKSLERLNAKWKRAVYDYEYLSALFDSADEETESDQAWQVELKSKQKEFIKLMGKICPLCKKRY